MSIAIFVVIHLTPTELRAAAQTMKYSLWVSLAFLVSGEFLGVELHGRTEEATLFINGPSSDALRYLTAATFPALAALCISIAVLISGETQIRTVLPWLLPAIVIVLLAFSRNHLIGIGTCIIITLVSSRSLAGLCVGILRTGIVAASAVLMWLFVRRLFGELTVVQWADLQVHAYADRVVRGLGSSELGRDPSTLYRQVENSYLIDAFYRNPLFGNGFGFSYKPAAGHPGTFLFDYAPFYAHNFWLWAAAKGGLVALTVVLIFVVCRLLVCMFRTRDALQRAVGASAIGLLAISFVAPIPLGWPSSLVLGVCIAIGGRPVRYQPEDAPSGGHKHQAASSNQFISIQEKLVAITGVHVVERGPIRPTTTPL